MPDPIEFDTAISILDGWVGKRVKCQVVGPSEILLHADGELQPRKPPETGGLVIYNLDSREGIGVWLWRDHTERILWVNNAQTILGFNTQGVFVSVGLDEGVGREAEPPA